MNKKDTDKIPSNTNELLPCPYCDNDAEYMPQTYGQAAAIYCTECPLGVEHSGMSFEALAIVWNTIAKQKVELLTQLEQCQHALQLWKKHIEISNEGDEDVDEGILAIIISRSKAINAMYDALGD